MARKARHSGFDTYTVAEAGTTMTFSFTPAVGLGAGDRIVATATDAANNTSSARRDDRHDQPRAVANGDSYSTNEDALLNVAVPGVLVNDSNADADAFEAVLVNGPLHGLALSPSARLFIPRRRTTSALTASNTLPATIKQQRRHSNAHGDAGQQRADRGQRLFTVMQASMGNQLNVLANDSFAPDVGETIRVVSVGQGNAGASITIGAFGTNILYSPPANFVGTDSFTYTITDRMTGGIFAQATVTVTVMALNEPPIAAADSYTTPEDTPLIVAAPGVLSNDTDPDGDPLTAVLVTGPTHGTLALAATGGFTYTPNANYNGLDSFTYRASDGLAMSGIATVSLNVAPAKASISGTAFHDLDQDGVFEPGRGETPLASRTIYLDLNNNGRFDSLAEPAQVTSMEGRYIFANLTAGQYAVGELESPEFTQSFPIQAEPRIRQLNLATNDIVFDSVSGRIFASVPSNAGANGNSVAIIDPVAGTVGSSVFVGSEPGKLAVADDGQYLYVALNGSAAVRRVDLNAFTAGLQFSLGGDPFTGPYYVADIEVLPGNADAVAVSRRNVGFSPSHEGVAIYDNGVQRPQETPGHTGSNTIEFSATSSVLYGYNQETTDFGFRRMSVDAGGVTITNATGNLLSGFGTDIEFDGGRVYATTGAVIDPEARLLLGTFQASGIVGPDSRRGLTLFAIGNQLMAFDQLSFRPLGTLSIPGFSGAAMGLIRWGTAGLALRTDSGKVF
jgi:hypothetical protein